jgi:cytochrome c553
VGGSLRPEGALAVAAAAVLAVAASAAKGPSSKVAWTPETVKLARSGDAAHGKKLHEDCSGCHGENGNADVPDLPNLGGQDPLYIFKQLQDYKAELRASPIMGEAVKTLSEKDMADLAAFYASQKPARASAGRPPGDAAAAGLASRGDGARLIVACDACHGQGGAGNPGFYGMPSLRNQKFDDLSLELTNFRSGDRANDVYRVMRDACKNLTDAEISGLAAYYSGTLPPAKK